MKKTTFLAAAILMGAAVTASPLQAMAAKPVRTQNVHEQKIKPINQIYVGKRVITEGLKEYLKNCRFDNVHVITIPCQPGTNQPDVPEVGVPETPGTNQPEAPEVELPETSETNQPGTNIPGTDSPETGTPETEQPDEGGSEEDYHAYVLRIVELVNEERAKAGLNALTLQENVTAAAQVRAVECDTLFSHTRPNGTSFSTALKEAGVSYRGAGENIAWGQKSPEKVVKVWMNSDGHRANILNEKYTTIGVGYYQDAFGVNYWSQLFTY